MGKLIGYAISLLLVCYIVYLPIHLIKDNSVDVVEDLSLSDVTEWTAGFAKHFANVRNEDAIEDMKEELLDKMEDEGYEIDDGLLEVLEDNELVSDINIQVMRSYLAKVNYGDIGKSNIDEIVLSFNYDSKIIAFQFQVVNKSLLRFEGSRVLAITKALESDDIESKPVKFSGNLADFYKV